ncbi:MAG: hypothetical protein IK095_03840, partial [Oscillospiraceae bacterium]|nr:hypothetical protein [Oscillospiraceae bacterium]
MNEKLEKSLAAGRVLFGKLRPIVWGAILLSALILIGAVGLSVSIRRNSMPEVERGEYRVVADDDALLKGAPTKLVVADGMLAAYFEDSG